MVSLFEDIGVVGGAVATLCALLVTLGFKKWGWPRVTGFFRAVGMFFRGMAALTELPQYMPTITRLGAIDETLAKIHKEVIPNGGSSLRDAVTATRDTVKRTEVALTVFINTTRAQWDGMGVFAVFEADESGDYTYVNNTYQKWTGRSETSVRGAGWVNCIATEDRDRVRAEWDSCVEDAREFSLEFRMHRLDGSDFPVTCTASPVAEYAGGPVHKWIGVIRSSQPGNSGVPFQ